MSTTNINVKILAEMLGIPSLNKGAKAVSGLESGFKKLAGAIGLGLGVAGIVNFGKESVKAFAADEKAAAILAQTLKNVGQGFRDAGVEDFITKTSLATGVLKNDLRTGFDTLIRSTKDASEAQKLLNLSLDISAGTGKDLGSVTTALGKSYLGQNTALGRLGVGLTSAQLKGKTFIEIQTQLDSLFKGDSAVAADTYAGKLKRVGVSFEEAKVTIGSGMVDAFTSLTSSGSFTGFVDGMQSAATSIANIIRGIGDIGQGIQSLPGAGMLSWVAKLVGLTYKYSAFGALQNLGASSKAKSDEATRLQNALTGGAGARTMQNTTSTIAAQNATAAALAKSNAEKAKQLKLDTAIAFLKKSMAVFDQQKIQIAAALANSKLTADEKARLQLMQTQADLQQAIDDKNSTVLDGLMNKIQALQDSLTNLQKTTIANPFQAATDGAIAMQSALYGLNAQLQASRGVNGLGGAYDLSNYSSVPLPGAMAAATATPTTTTVNLVLDGQQIQQVVVDNTASGSPSTYSRNLGAPLRDSW